MERQRGEIHLPADVHSPAAFLPHQRSVRYHCMLRRALDSYQTLTLCHYERNLVNHPWRYRLYSYRHRHLVPQIHQPVQEDTEAGS